MVEEVGLELLWNVIGNRVRKGGRVRRVRTSFGGCFWGECRGGSMVRSLIGGFVRVWLDLGDGFMIIFGWFWK